MIILLSFVILIMIDWVVRSHVQLPEHSLLGAVEDELGHSFIIVIIIQKALSDENSAYHDDGFCCFASHDQVFLLVGALNPKL